MILSILLIAHKLWVYHDEITITWNTRLIMQIGMAGLIYALIVFISPIIFQNTLYISTGKKVRFERAGYIYCKSNMFKYLPGNVMHYVGRNEIAERENLPHAEVACSTILEIVITVLAAGILAFLFSWHASWEWMTQFAGKQIQFALVGSLVILVALLMICKLYWKKVSSMLVRLFSLKNLFLFGGSVMFQCLILFADSLLYFAVLDMMGIRMDVPHYFPAVGLYALSFLLGYLTPGAPGGIGIREMVMTFFFSSYLLQEQILTGALIFRIVTVLGDFLGFGISFVFLRILSFCGEGSQKEKNIE